MSSSTIIFSHVIGLIFAVGGIVFMIGLDDNRFLFGIPYLVIGVVIIGGVLGAQRRLRRKALEESAGEGPEGGRRSPY